MKKSRILRSALACLAMSVVAWAQTIDTSGIAAILRQSRAYQYQFRVGQYDDAPKFVAMMEEATKANPENADLWNGLGTAYLAQVAGGMLAGGNPADAWPGLQRGMKALERAIELNPDQAEALVIHGGVQAMLAAQRAPQQARKGVAEMNRAAELAPSLMRVRLARAFNGLNLPDALRNHEAEAEDLDFVIQAARGTRQGDYVQILRGDLDFELGKVDLAKSRYELVSKSESPAALEAKARLSALDLGGVSAADIKRLRSAAGANCTMCHGK